MPIKKDLGFKENEKFNLLKAVDYFLENKEDKFKERNYFYMSEANKPINELYKSFIEKKPFKIDAKGARVFANGDYVHTRFQKLFAEMRILVASEIEMNTDLIHGRCDAIITDGEQNYIVEIKSMSQWSFQKLVNPTEDHVIQLLLYMHFFNIPRGILFVECKDNQAVREFYLEMNEENKQKVENTLKKLEYIRECINNNVIPQELLSLSNDNIKPKGL